MWRGARLQPGGASLQRRRRLPLRNLLRHHRSRHRERRATARSIAAKLLSTQELRRLLSTVSASDGPLTRGPRSVLGSANATRSPSVAAGGQSSGRQLHHPPPRAVPLAPSASDPRRSAEPSAHRTRDQRGPAWSVPLARMHRESGSRVGAQCRRDNLGARPRPHLVPPSVEVASRMFHEDGGMSVVVLATPRWRTGDVFGERFDQHLLSSIVMSSTDVPSSPCRRTARCRRRRLRSWRRRCRRGWLPRRHPAST